jgi:hypothetical protein
MFGTFMPAFKTEKDEDENGGRPKARADAKSTLRLPPTLDAVAFATLSAACLAPWAASVCARSWVAGAALALPRGVALLFSVLAGFGPVAVACVMAVVNQVLFSRARVDNAKAISFPARTASALLAPFHKKPITENLLHVSIGLIFCAVPIAAACYLTLK